MCNVTGRVAQYRCRRKTCQKITSPHHGHKISGTAWGQVFVDLQAPATILFCHTVGMKQLQTCRLLKVNERIARHLGAKLDKCRRAFVVRREQKIKFGQADPKNYFDVEADEVDLGKALVDEEAAGGAEACWEQWAGSIQRGYPETRTLFKTTPKKTKTRAQGPGPIERLQIQWTDARHPSRLRCAQKEGGRRPLAQATSRRTLPAQTLRWQHRCH